MADIKVLLKLTDRSDVFIFNQLFDQDEMATARAFCIAQSYEDIFDFARAIGADVDVVIRYNSKDFAFEDAPEFYGVILKA